MPRKSNPEKDIVISSASAAAARSRRASTATRTPRSQAAAESGSRPARPAEAPARDTTFVAEQALSHEEIARMAYALWEARGCQHGNPEEDWRRAEEELRRRDLAGRA